MSAMAFSVCTLRDTR